MLIFVHATVKSVMVMKWVFFWKLNDVVWSNILLFSILRNHFRCSYSSHWVISGKISIIIKVKYFFVIYFNRTRSIVQYINTKKQQLYTVMLQWGGLLRSALVFVLDICNYRALFRCPYLSTPWVKIYYFTKYHRSMIVWYNMQK